MVLRTYKWKKGLSLLKWILITIYFTLQYIYKYIVIKIHLKLKPFFHLYLILRTIFFSKLFAPLNVQVIFAKFSKLIFKNQIAAWRVNYFLLCRTHIWNILTYRRDTKSIAIEVIYTNVCFLQCSLLWNSLQLSLHSCLNQSLLSFLFYHY